MRFNSGFKGLKEENKMAGSYSMYVAEKKCIEEFDGER
jgi:hypothetical protein